MPITITPDPLSLLRPVGKTATVTKTRPANTTTYTAGQTISESTTVGTIWTFPWARAPGLGAILQGAVMIVSTAQALKLDAQLWLFDTAPATTLNDGTAWAPTDAEMKTFLHMVAFGAGNAQVGAGNTETKVSAIAEELVCAAGSSSIYGVLRVNNAYIPTSGEDITIRLQQIQD